MFDRVVVLNLDRRPDRLSEFLKQNPPFHPERISAIDGSELRLPPYFRNSPGAYGCLLSHHKILNQAVEDGVESLLVFEDDALFCDNFRERCAEFLQAVPSDWDGLMLGGHYREDSRRFEVNDKVLRVSGVILTHAFAIRGRYLKHAASVIGNYYRHCDYLFAMLQQHFRVYAPRYPWLVMQSGSKSDINV